MAGESNGRFAPSPIPGIPEIKFTKLFINGEFLDAVSGLSLSPSLCLSTLWRLIALCCSSRFVYVRFLRLKFDDFDHSFVKNTCTLLCCHYRIAFLN